MDSYNMSVKQRCRKRLRKFLQKTFKKDLKKGRDIRVLCLPGREAIEVYEVYDKLGIKRENITCLERDKKVAAELKRRKLGCKIVNMDFNDFAEKNHKQPFDIISLDFMGQLGTFENSIYKMSTNRAFSKKSVLYTNFCGARETLATQGLYRDHDIMQSVLKAMRTEFHNDLTEEQLGKLREDFDGACNIPLKDARDTGITQAIARCIEQAVSPISFIMSNSDNYKFAIEMAKKTESKPLPKAVEAIKKSLDKKDDVLNCAGMFFGIEETRMHLQNSLSEVFDGSGFGNVDIPLDEASELLLRACFRGPDKAYCVTDAASFRYTSSNGMPMMSDILKVQLEDSFVPKWLFNNRAKTYEHFFEPTRNAEPEDMARALVIVARSVEREQHLRQSLLESRRVYLGSEKSLHPKVEPKLPQDPKVAAIDLMTKNPNMTLEDISLLIGESVRRIAAWKAHMTMGTYA